MQEVFEKIIERLKELQKAFPITSEDEYFRGVGIGYKGAIEDVQQVAAEYKENDAFNRVYEKVVSIEREYAENGNIENVNRCIRLENLMQYFREELKGCNNGYNNGWIPVESGTYPTEYEDVEVTIEETIGDAGEKRYYTARSWWQDGQWAIKKKPYHPTVIAWRYPTEPYQPKGE